VIRNDFLYKTRWSIGSIYSPMLLYFLVDPFSIYMYVVVVVNSFLSLFLEALNSGFSKLEKFVYFIFSLSANVGVALILRSHIEIKYGYMLFLVLAALILVFYLIKELRSKPEHGLEHD
jgi:hypothetical protein